MMRWRCFLRPRKWFRKPKIELDNAVTADREVVILIVLGMVLFMLGTVTTIGGDQRLDILNNLIGAMSTLGGALLGAFYGARYAYQLQQNKADQDQLTEHYEAANSTLFALSYFLNTQFLYPSRPLNSRIRDPCRASGQG